MYWSNEAIIYYPIIEEYIGNFYKIFKLNINKDSDEMLIEIIYNNKFNEKIELEEIYSFFTLKLYDLIDKYCSSIYYFDQLFAGYPSKSQHLEINKYSSDNEIFNIANEFGFKSPDTNIIRQIFSRIRFLAKNNIWNPSIDYLIDNTEITDSKYYETENFKIYFKKYIDNHPKNLRYLGLLRKALIQSYYFRSKIFVAVYNKELNSVLSSSFIYVMLEPYNHIIDS
jgi:hypothetical protein